MRKTRFACGAFILARDCAASQLISLFAARFAAALLDTLLVLHRIALAIAIVSPAQRTA
jgi:hypothetical protein